jgi:hypothetical protein
MSQLRMAPVALAAALWLVGCFAPPTHTQRLTDAARELNLAARFGRMDIAASHAARGARETFLQRRSQWGRDVRVIDVALTSLALDETEQHALITVDVAWTRIDEGSLRNTQVAQVWRDEEGTWQLTRERRVAGDIGLFGEPVQVVRPPSPDVHFESKTIR